MEINGHTRLAAVVATPIKHSISPFIHNYAFQAQDVNAVYVAWDIPREDLEESIKNIRRYDMLGVNISMPYKKDVIEYLDGLSEAAELIGAVNCVSNEDGKLIGHNTDAPGFFKALDYRTGFKVEGQEVTILGAGGAGQAIITQAALDHAKQINIFNQTEFLEETRQQAAALTEKTGTPIDVYPIEDKGLIEEMTSRSSLLINATSVGMDGESMVIDPDMSFPEGLVVADVIYQPFETPFLKLAKSKGLKAINGLGMLLFQAAISYQIWTGQEMPIDEIWQALEEKYDK